MDSLLYRSAVLQSFELRSLAQALKDCNHYPSMADREFVARVTANTFEACLESLNFAAFAAFLSRPLCWL